MPVLMFPGPPPLKPPRKVKKRPQFMGPGSKGLLVYSLNQWLAGYFNREMPTIDDGFMPTDFYGDGTVLRVKLHQEMETLSQDGVIDPETERFFAENGFRFDHAARVLVEMGFMGPTTFVQRNGEHLLWSPAPDWEADPEPGDTTPPAPSVSETS